MTTTHTDQFGTEIAIGDTVRCTQIDSGRGAIADLIGMNLTVVGLGRTRIKITSPGRTGTDTIGAECVAVTTNQGA